MSIKMPTQVNAPTVAPRPSVNSDHAFIEITEAYCPGCGASGRGKLHNYARKKSTRYYRCRACGLTFKAHLGNHVVPKTGNSLAMAVPPRH